MKWNHRWRRQTKHSIPGNNGVEDDVGFGGGNKDGSGWDGRLQPWWCRSYIFRRGEGCPPPRMVAIPLVSVEATNTAPLRLGRHSSCGDEEQETKQRVVTDNTTVWNMGQMSLLQMKVITSMAITPLSKFHDSCLSCCQGEWKWLERDVCCMCGYLCIPVICHLPQL